MMAHRAAPLILLLAIVSLHPISGADDSPYTTLMAACSSGSVGCYRAPADCAPDDCRAAVAYGAGEETADGWLQLEMAVKWDGSEGADRYVAVGFSEDDQMGADATTACVLNTVTSATSPVLGYNADGGKENGDLPAQDTTGNVELISSTVEDGRYYCKLRQRIVPKTKVKVFSLDKAYYLLLAVGPRQAGKLGYHSYKQSSGAAVDVSTSVGAAAGGKSAERESLEHALKRTHGSLMITAWWLFSTLAIILAGFYKPAWRGKTILGKPIWFQLHRGFNLTCVLLTILAAVAIVVAEGVEINGRHQIVGLVALVLGWFNPINALFRCHPGTDNRWLFNLVHRLCGCVAWVLASTAIFMTVWDFRTIWKDATFALIVMIVYVVVLLLVNIALELLCIAARKKRDTSVGDGAAGGGVPMSDMRNGSAPATGGDEANAYQPDGARTAIYAVMALVAIAAVVILIVLLAIS